MPFDRGRFESGLPEHLVELYDRYRNDPDILVQRDSIALLEVRLMDVLQGIKEGVAAPNWVALRKVVRTVKEELPERISRELMLAVEDLNTLCEQGSYRQEQWTEVRGLVQDIRKISDTEQKRIVTAQHVMRADEVMALVDALGGLVRENVKDADALRRIETGIARFIGQKPVGQIGESA